MKNVTERKVGSFLISLSLLLLAACSKDNDNAEKATVVTATGDINSKLNDFRQLLGSHLNTNPGAVDGRREINWDGVPDQMLNQKLPLNFFNPTDPGAPAANQRGLKYSAAGNFQVSKTNFAEVNAAASGEFSSFSGDKNFANVSSNLWEVGFEVPGQAVPAFVKGFGIVFSDVDLSNSVSLEFFNEEKSLGKFFAPAKNGSNFSFLGVYFKNERITKIRVAHDGQLDNGESDISNNGPADLIVMDNFLYNEPVKK